MDAFSQILSGVQLTGAVFFSAEFSAPWGLATGAAKAPQPSAEPARDIGDLLPVGAHHGRAHQLEVAAGDDLAQWQRTVTEMKASGSGDFATLSVGLESVRKLAD